MAVAWRSIGAYCNRSSPGTGALTVTQPAGHQTGDVLILFAACLQAGVPVINTPAGWTLIVQSAGWDGNGIRSAVFYKVAASSAEPSVSLTTASISYLDAQITAFSGCDTTTPIDANTAAWVQSGASSTSFTLQAITTATANTMLFYLINDSDGAAYTTPPAGVTERSEAGFSSTMVTATKPLATASGEPTATYAKTNAGSHGGNGFVLALRELGSGGGGGEVSGPLSTRRAGAAHVDPVSFNAVVDAVVALGGSVADRKAGAAAVDADDFNQLVDAVVTLGGSVRDRKAGSAGPDSDDFNALVAAVVTLQG